MVRSVIPSGHTLDDFRCFGPVAMQDDSFDHAMMVDLGCFNQDSGVDSNKRFHAAVCQSKKNGKWFLYTEWARTGHAAPQFQFEEALSKEHAHELLVKKVESKNIKRGEWVNILGLGRVLRPKMKNGKPDDLYLVRALEKRTSGLPDGRNIIADGSVIPKPQAIKKTAKAKTKKVDSRYDAPTLQLMRDMNVGVQQYTRSQFATTSDVPSQRSLTEARDILSAAQKRVAEIGGSVREQLRDKTLRDLSALIYARVPKIKPVGGGDESWILSQNNLMLWSSDLDAFESSLFSGQIEQPEIDPFEGMRIEMEWLPPSAELGKFIRTHMARATLDRHESYGNATIHNVWRVKQLDLEERFPKSLDRIGVVSAPERPILQPESRPDLAVKERKRYQDSHVALLWHGSRSCNCPGILRTGLRLPKQLTGVILNNQMFGDGAYFADDWKKSAGYCSLSNSYWTRNNMSGAVRGRAAFMFLVDVALGRPHLAQSGKGYTSPPPGCHSVFGKAAITKIAPSFGGGYLANNEWIIYEVDQHRLRYLIEFSA